jgi:6-phospho-3-hexuloisomerase
MPPLEEPAPHRSWFADAVELELRELHQLMHALQPGEIKPAVDMLMQAPRIFATGAGRSGLAVRMGAMRLMHLGRPVHIVGETTTPALAPGDLLLVASASGASAAVLQSAAVARQVGANVLAITAQPQGPLAAAATHVVTLAAATKDQQRERVSQQYAGSLFEQGVVLLLDAIFHGVWQASGTPAETLMKRHANLE